MYTMLKILMLPVLIGLTRAAPGPASLEIRPLLNNSIHSLTSQMLYGLPDQNSGNVVFSPFSLHTVLTMLYTGADGQTKAELSSLLKVNKTDAVRLKAEYRDLLRSYSKLIDQLGTNIEVANAIFTDQNFNLREEFKTEAADNFLAKVDNLDFSKSAKATKEINSWVENKTLGFIKDFLPESSISGDTKSVIINGVYFKASWFYPFDEERNFIGRFLTSQNESVNTEYMVATEPLGVMYNNSLGCEILSLPYLDEDYHMLIFKPDNTSMMNSLVNGFENLNLVDIHNHLERDHSKLVRLEMPKFSVSYKASLLDTLSQLGVSNLDDLSLISEDNLFISEFMHAAKIVVNEEGSEVAAVSGAVLDLRSVIKPQVVKLNSSFLFVILDTARSIPLIVGRIGNPSESEVLSLRSTGDIPAVENSIPDLAVETLPLPSVNMMTTQISDCSPPCANGGKCADGSCVCQPEYEGSYCQHAVEICRNETLGPDAVVFPCKRSQL